MRFVKSREEIWRLKSVNARPEFLDGRYLTVWFETEPDIAAALLPPPLEPAEPIGNIWIGDIADSNCVGGFLGAALYIRARYQDIAGNYCVTMPMSTSEAIIFGRELYGEPKKLADIAFRREGDRIFGAVERHGVRYISLEGSIEGAEEGGRRKSSIFHFKYLPRPDGEGFDHPPVLVQVKTEFDIRVAERASATLGFVESPHDPVADIPVKRIVHALYTEGDVRTEGEILCEVDTDAFLPYSFGKMDDLEVVARRALAARGQR